MYKSSNSPRCSIISYCWAFQKVWYPAINLTNELNSDLLSANSFRPKYRQTNVYHYDNICVVYKLLLGKTNEKLTANLPALEPSHANPPLFGYRLETHGIVNIINKCTINYNISKINNFCLFYATFLVPVS